MFAWLVQDLQPQVKVRICEGKAVETSHSGVSTEQTAVLRPASFPFATRKLPLCDEQTTVLPWAKCRFAMYKVPAFMVQSPALQAAKRHFAQCPEEQRTDNLENCTRLCR